MGPASVSRSRRPPSALESRPGTSESRTLEDDYPEAAADKASIIEVRHARSTLLSHALADSWAQGKSGWKRLEGERVRTGDPSSALFDASIRSNALSNDELEATLLEYGGREHCKTIARIMSLGARRSAGVDEMVSERVRRAVEQRVYIAPKSTLDPPSGPTGRRRNGGSSNPLARRAGGLLRHQQPLHAGRGRSRHGGAAEGGTSPMSRVCKLPESPQSPLHGSHGHSPLARPSAAGSFSASGSPGGDGFAKGMSKVQGIRARKKDHILSSMLGIGDSALEAKKSEKFGEPVSKGAERRERGASMVQGVGSRRYSSMDDSGSSDSVTENRARNPLSPLIAARALTSPHLLPMKGRGGKRASAQGVLPTGHMDHTWKKEEEDPNVYAGGQKQGWHEQVMRLRAVISDGVRINWKMTSPLTDLERIILSQSKWRVDENALDVHDKVVLAGMPFHPKKIIKNEGALRALGQAVLNPDPLIREAGLAALGDRNNFGNPSCLAQVVPRLTDPDPRVKAAALRGIEQIAKPGDDKQFMEVEIEVFGASNLPKKDRFGACDGYVILTLKHPGEPDKEVGRTGIKWQELNPRWRQNFYIEIREPGVDSIEFSVWDEDGESDDICGVCSLPVKDIEFDEATGAKPQLSRTLQILNQNTDEPIRGWNPVALQNTGELSKLQIRARYTAYLRPKDLVNQFIQLLEDGHAPTRSAALDTVASFCTIGNVLILQAVANMLEDSESHIRQQAALRLEELAGVNDPYVIQLTARRMDHCDPNVRHIAVETLPRVATKGNAFAISQVAKRLESRVAVIRGLVSEALPGVADEGDPNALKEITLRFGHKSAEVRQAAILAFTTITPVGSHDMISRLEPMMGDEDQSCRMAAVQALYRISNVGPLGDATVLARARTIFQQRIDLNNGAGDPNRVILDSVKKALATLNQDAPWIYGCDPAKAGEFHALLPARWVRISRDKGVFTELVDPMPIDTKFNSSLPYRPPSPPWDPKSVQKVGLNRIIASAKEELLNARNGIAQLEEEMEARDLSLAEEYELEEMRKKEVKYSATLENAQAEFKELLGDVEVQPPNTTKLGFTTLVKTGHGEHCQRYDCKRSACF